MTRICRLSRNAAKFSLAAALETSMGIVLGLLGRGWDAGRSCSSNGRGGFLASAVLVVAVATGPGSASAAETTQKLTFAMISNEELTLVAKGWQEPLKYLGKKLGVEIKYYPTTSYAAVAEAMMGGFVDMAMLAPEIYILTHEKAPYIVSINGLSRPATKFLPEACACYHSLLVTKRDGKYQKIEDLKKAIVALPDPASTSGSSVPRAFFPEVDGGQQLDQYFGQIFYAGAHDAAMKAVLAGRADAAFVSDNALSRGIDRGVFKMDSFNVLWRSPKIPAMPMTVNTQTVSNDMIKKIQVVLADLKDDPQGQAVLKQLHATDLPPISDDMFDPLRQALNSTEKAKQN